MSARTCPPCDSRCNQGRDCPAANLDAGEPLSEEESNFLLKVALTAFGAFVGIISGGAWLLLKVGCGA